MIPARPNSPHDRISTDAIILARSAFKPQNSPPTQPDPKPPTPEVCPKISTSEWVRTHLNFHPDPAQAALLDNPNDHRLILCCTRQWGKSTIVAAKALHVAWTNPDSLVLFASASLRQSNQLLRKLKRFANKLTGNKVTQKGGELTLPNGSCIVALPQNPDTIRCYSAPALIVIDEAAFVSDELFNAISPSLAASNGALWLLSSPNGESGFFFEIWHAQHPDWTACKVTALECPRISQAFLDSERRLKGESTFLQEYMAEFVNGGGQILSISLVESRFSPHVRTRF